MIQRRIRRSSAGVDLVADVNAVVAANVDERGGTTTSSSHQTVVHNSRAEAHAASDDEETSEDRS